MSPKRILLTAGGTGGHIYPTLAVAEELKRIGRDDVTLYFIGPKSPFENTFRELSIPVKHVAGAKLRRYFALENFIDVPKFCWSIIQALAKVFRIMPDIVFSKGGPGTLAVIIAARWYRIPVVLHESDSVPSLNTRLAARFARLICLSFESTKDYFRKREVLFTGNPVRRELLQNLPTKQQAAAHFKLAPDISTLLVLGGSQGAASINNFVVNHMPELLDVYQVIHQTGEQNKKQTEIEAGAVLRKHPGLAERYRCYGSLDVTELKHAFALADIVLSRAGAGIFETAAFGKPSILVPLEGSANNHQKMNAYQYAQGGTRAVVIEESNFSSFNIVNEQIQNILKSRERYGAMSVAALRFAKPDAAQQVAGEIMRRLA